MHRGKELLSSERRLLELHYADGVDDLIPMIQAEDADRIRAYLTDFEAEMAHKAYTAELEYKITRLVYESKRDYAVATKDSGRQWMRALTFSLWDGKVSSMREGLDKMVIRSLTTGKKFEDMKDTLCLYPDWEGVTDDAEA